MNEQIGKREEQIGKVKIVIKEKLLLVEQAFKRVAHSVECD